MTSLQNAARAAAFTGNINQVYSGLSLNTSLDILTDTFTIETGDIATTSADFVPFTSDGYLDLAASRVRIGGLITNVLAISVQLQKVTLGTTFVGTTTASSVTVTTSQTGLLVGMVVSGTGITAGTTIATITATGFTLSAATAATGFGVLTLVASGAANISAALAIAATAATAATAAQAVPFVPVDGGPPVTFAKGDKLRLVITAVTSLGIGRTLIPSIPFVTRLSPGTTP
jgi:hypothetical protein